MATQRLRVGDDPVIKYLAVTFKLAQKLQFADSTAAKARFAADSIDRSNREIITVGASVEEHTIIIRYDDEPQGLKEMLEAGADGTQLDYYPSLGGGTNFSFIVITGSDQITITPDPDRHRSHGEWMATARIRMVGGDTMVSELT